MKRERESNRESGNETENVIDGNFVVGTRGGVNPKNNDGQDGSAFWFAGFNNACQWRGGLTETDIADMIAKKEIRLSKPATYTNGQEIGA